MKQNENYLKAVNGWSNSFLHPLVPPSLLKNSKILKTEDDGAKLIYLKFLYGIQIGTNSTRPTDGRNGNVIRDLSEESLWSYSLGNEKIPEGFNEKTYDGGIIGTGDVRKCNACKGQGEVRCTTCGGKIRWTSESFNGDRTDHVCSCGNGKEMCGTCTGYGELEVVIEVKKQFKVFQTKSSQYTGEVPENRIKKITGDLIYEHIYEYPMSIMQEMLVGGIDVNEFNSLNDNVLSCLKDNIDEQLSHTDINTEKIRSQLENLFSSIPNPGKENKVLQNESMPIRVMVRVENAPVKQIDYEYKEKKYSIWLYGLENSIWKQKVPVSFNYKLVTILILLIGGSIGVLYGIYG